MFLDAEREKYGKAWALDAYRKYSPGQRVSAIFRELAAPGATVIDIGCGAGAGGRALQEAGFDVSYLDLDRFDESVPADRFIRAAVWDDWSSGRWDYGYCCDVLEHLPPEMVSLSVYRIRERTDAGFFSIGLKDDHFGREIDERLHLTVRPFTWWRDFLRQFGDVEEARDLNETGVYLARWC